VAIYPQRDPSEYIHIVRGIEAKILIDSTLDTTATRPMYSTDERYQHNALVIFHVTKFPLGEIKAGRGEKKRQGGDCGGTYQFILMW